MKIAHLADSHLGFRQYHRTTATGANVRETDIAQAFRAAVDGVIAARPDAVIVAGDLFHGPRPPNAAIVFAVAQFQRLRSALPDAPVVLVAGNHDTPRIAEGGSILSLFAAVGVDVALDRPRRFHYPALDLSVLAVPHATLIAPDRPAFEPDGAARYQVLVLHGDTESQLVRGGQTVEHGGAMVGLGELPPVWNYVAFGHYHVQHEIAPRVWYAGALEYVSTNPWGELADEAGLGIDGKGWLLADLATGEVERMPVSGARRHLLLEPIGADGMTAEALSAAIAARLAEVPGGIADAIVRLRLIDVPRQVERALDHRAIRAAKAAALNFTLDVRRPAAATRVGMTAAGRRKTVNEIVIEFLAKRDLPTDVDREAFAQLGSSLMAEVAEMEPVATETGGT